MQLVAKLGQDYLPDPLSVSGRAGIDINNEEGVVQLASRGVERGHEGMPFRRRLHGEARRWIERGIRF
jgi:hypothetical protein